MDDVVDTSRPKPVVPIDMKTLRRLAAGEMVVLDRVEIVAAQDFPVELFGGKSWPRLVAPEEDAAWRADMGLPPREGGR